MLAQGDLYLFRQTEMLRGSFGDHKAERRRIKRKMPAQASDETRTRDPSAENP